MLQANLGDCGVLLVRGKAVAQATPPLQHSFNFPYQLGCQDLGAASDLPSDADQFEVDLQKGDVIVMASDGLIDNVYPEEVAEIVAEFSPISNFTADDLANALAARWAPAL